MFIQILTKDSFVKVKYKSDRDENLQNIWELWISTMIR